MKLIRTEDAVGHVLCHDLTQIIKDQYKDARFRKGHVVAPEDIPVLLGMGKEHLYVWEMTPGMLHEDEGAERLLALCANENMERSGVKEGKIELIADCDGLLKIDRAALLAVNRTPQMMIATIHGDMPVKKGQKLAGTRIIPLVIEQEKMDAMQAAAGSEPILNVLPFHPKKFAVITTGSEVFKGRIEDKFTPILVGKLAEYGERIQSDIRFMGVPKTIDNDLFGTDHCPGFASAAKYIATSCMEIYQDARVYDTGMVCIVEIMGRHAGWLAGAAGLATAMGAGPDLVYLPETDFDMKKFLADVKRIYDEKGNCLVAVSEGIHYADGSFVSEAKTSATDGFGHAQLGGLASMLADTVKNELGCKVRGIELSLLQRCAAHCASKTDVDESYMSGKAAVENAVAGKTDYMPGFKCTRDENGYKCEIELLPLSEVANTEKKVPREWINEEGNGVTQEFVDYALPLINGENVGPKVSGLPRFANLKKIKAEA